MDFFSKSLTPQVHPPNLFEPPPDHSDSSPAPLPDSITSLMNMADKMEALLPPDCDLSLPLTVPPPHSTPDTLTTHSSAPYLSDCLSSVTAATHPDLSFKQDLTPPIPLAKPEPSSFPLDIALGLHHRTHPSQPTNITEVSPAPDFTSALLDTKAPSPDIPVPPPPPPPPPPLPHHSPLPLPTHPTALHPLSAKTYGAPHTSPCAIRDLRDMTDVTTLADTVSQGRLSVNTDPSPIYKPRKTGRKPKTYSKPVASRFCHICSRMPRRGQGSATCRRMSEGFCRKIVCEQCIREQGWDYEGICRNPGSWLCPHCAEICPARSQCHIYNRINARRKRAGGGKKLEQASVAAAMASSDVLMGPYGHLWGGGNGGGGGILQPPPNFRLNLPPQYTRL